MQNIASSTATTRPAAADIPDADLARRAANGDDVAFECIMRRHNGLLFRTARSILSDDADAEDALQDAYLNAWRALSTFRAESRLSTWLVRIVANEAIGRLRRRGAQVISLATVMNDTEPAAQAWLEDDPDRRPDRSAMREQLRRLMEARIDMLPGAFRTVFVLRAIEDMSVEEVAAALGIPESTVRTRFFRARGLLREGLSCDVDLAIDDAFGFAGERCDRIVSSVLNRLAAGRP